MPGRTSSRATRTSTTSTTRKSSTTRAGSARQSSNVVEIPDEGPDTSLRKQVAQVFGDAQKTTTTQRKLVVNLRKIQEACCFEPPDTNKKGGKKGKGEVQEDFDEEDFSNEVVRCVLRILGVKKSEPVGDRIIRFLGVFLKHASEKGEHNNEHTRVSVLTHRRSSDLCRRNRRRSHSFARDAQQPPHLQHPHHGPRLPQRKRQGHPLPSHTTSSTHRQQPDYYRRRHLQPHQTGLS